MKMTTTMRSSKTRNVAEQPNNVEEEGEEEEVVVEEKIEIPVRVFLYLQLRQISNLPETEHKLKIVLRQVKNTITKLEDHYTTDTSIDLTVFDVYKPTFSITMEQDSIEDLNIFSDNPLIITLYERILVRTVPVPSVEESYEEELTMTEEHVEEEEEEYEYLNPVAQGHIDLLQFYSTKRILTKVDSFLYPINRALDPQASTCFASWQFYTLLPLLKELSFCNMTFFTFESLYNIPSILLEDTIDLVADFSIQSTILNEEKSFDKVHLCTFCNFSKEVIGTQNYHVKWETMRNVDMENKDCLGVHSGNSINIYKLFRHVLGTEGVNFNFDQIECDEEALICNSQHRFVLTEELVKNLETVIAFDEFRLLIEVYDQNTPERILLQGTQDLSVLVFPEVNACRFAVELRPPVKRKTSYGIAIKPDPERPIFAIISICFLTPITAVPTKISAYNDSQGTTMKLRTCRSMPRQMFQLSIQNLCAKTYKSLDDSIKELIDYIIQNEIKSVAEAKNFLCCHKQNLTNKIMKLVSCDFNIRFPTKNIIEFTNLMPIVYKELVQRVYELLRSCNVHTMTNCSGPTVANEERLLNFMSAAKVLNEAGQQDVANILQEKVVKLNGSDLALSFYMHIYDLERLNYESATTYLQKPIAERFNPGEPFVPLLEIYIKYMQMRTAEKIYNEAFEYLLESVRAIAPSHPEQISTWILLYCLYKLCGYLPGTSYARWKFENLLPCATITSPTMPKSRWEIYNTYDFQFDSQKSIMFYRVFELYARLGMYAFAELVFQQLSSEASDLEVHLVTATLKILMNEIPATGFPPKTFPTPSGVDPGIAATLRAHQAHINGHLEYANNMKEEAARTYENMLHIQGLENFEFFALGLLRCGFQMMGEKKFANAVGAFSRCCALDALKLAAPFYVGKALLKLHQLEEAEKCFIECTKHKVHIPDVWGYLAVINLKLQKNIKALEFWKYAKIDLKRDVSTDVYLELSGISYDDIVLYLSPQCDSL